MEIFLVKRLAAAALAFSAQDASLLRSFKEVMESPSRSRKPPPLREYGLRFQVFQVNLRPKSSNLTSCCTSESPSKARAEKHACRHITQKTRAGFKRKRGKETPRNGHTYLVVCTFLPIFAAKKTRRHLDTPYETRQPDSLREARGNTCTKLKMLYDGVTWEEMILLQRKDAFF